MRTMTGYACGALGTDRVGALKISAKKTREAERANAVRDKFEIENRLKTLNGESAAVEETSYSLHR